MPRGNPLAITLATMLLCVCVGLTTGAVAQDGTSSSAPAAAKPGAGPEAELDTATQAGLYKIAQRFGQPSAQGIAMSILLDLAGPDSDMAALQQSIREVCAALEQSNCGPNLAVPPQPTGDALWDRYAAAVDARLNALAPDDSEQVDVVGLLPDELLAQWEPEFGNDARYWELRYLCAVCAGDAHAYAPGFTRPADYLRAARERGCSSANTLLLLYRELVKEHEALLEPLTDYQPAESPAFSRVLDFALPARPEFTADTLSQAAALHAQCEAEQLALLDAAVAAGQQQAWAYYLRAQYWLELGEQELALADMQSGNAAAVNVYPRPFPCALVADGLSAEAPPGSAAVCGAVLLMQLNYPPPDYALIRSQVYEACTVASLSGDARLLEAWQQFACRWPAALPDDAMPVTVAQVNTSMIRRYFLEDQLGALNPEQRETLERALRLREELHEIELVEVYSLDPAGWLLVLGIAGGVRGAPVAMYLNCEQQSQFVTQQALPRLADLSTLHYPELALSEALRKYEPMADLELAVARQGRRVGNHCEINAQHARGDYSWDKLVQALERPAAAATTAVQEPTP